MRKLYLLLGMIVLLATTSAKTQQPQQPTTYEGYVALVWKKLHYKILDMAKDFPEEKLGWRPHPDSRSMLEEFRHVTIGIEMSAAELRGERFDYMKRVKADSGKPGTRASLVGEMEAAIAVSYPLVESSPKTAPRVLD